MTRTNQDFEMYAGDTKDIRVTVEYNGPNTDLSGSSVVFVMDSPEGTGINFASGGEPLITKTTAGGGVELTDPTNGVFVVTLDSDDTDGMSGRYKYEIEVTDSGGNVSTVTTGEITIHRSRAGV